MRLDHGGRHRRRPGARRQRGRLPRRRARWASSRSPTAWAATAPARSRAPPRSRRCAPPITRGHPLARVDRRTPTRPSSPSRSPTTSCAGMGTTLTAATLVDRRHAARRPRRRLARVPAARRRAPPDHRRPQPGRGARPRGPAHRRRGRGPPAALDHHARARRRRSRSRSTCTRWSSRRATASCSAPTASPTWCSADDHRRRPCAARSDPHARRDAARRRRQRRRRRGQHHRRSSIAVTDEAPVARRSPTRSVPIAATADRRAGTETPPGAGSAPTARRRRGVGRVAALGAPDRRSCSASRSARSAGTRGGATTSALRPGPRHRVQGRARRPASGGTRPIEQRTALAPISSGPPTSPR